MDISIARDFSNAPWGRFPTDGNFCGEIFRETILRPALVKNDHVRVDLDHVEGFGSSFLDEAFGGLVRKGYFTAEQLMQKLEVKTTQPDFTMYVDLIGRYIRDSKFASEAHALASA